MKKISFAALCCALLAAACNGGKKDVGSPGDTAPPRSLSSGQYNISEVTFSQDQCLLSNLPSPLSIFIDGDSITFTDMGGANVPTGTFSSDTFTARADYVYDNTQDDPAIDCHEHIIKEVHGTIDGVDTFQGEFMYDDSVTSGNQCTSDWLGYPVPCISHATFRATRVP